MQPTPTTATAAGAATTVALTSRWDNATGSPTAEPDPILDNYVLLVVVMSLFVGGALVVLSGVLLLCRRCWEAHRRFNRATEEAEKTTTTYLDNGAHPAQDPDFRGEDPEGQDAETERFLSTSYTGRRVSFNEAALFEQSRKSQDKGRRSSQSTSATWVKSAQPPLPTLLPPPRPTSPYSSPRGRPSPAALWAPAPPCQVTPTTQPWALLTSRSAPWHPATPGKAPGWRQVPGALSLLGQRPRQDPGRQAQAPGPDLSCSSLPACGAMPAWMGPAPTSRSRSGSWTPANGHPVWTLEAPPSGTTSSGSEQPARAQSRRRGTPPTWTSSNTSPAQARLWPSRPPTPFWPAPPAHPPLSARGSRGGGRHGRSEPRVSPRAQRRCGA
uniref:voltage-dependent calcium channel beta subunit-associated regulatory protein-like isoform X3 n=1 Tax=Halichoerus grypus TaxID=9711 RepID=UPI001658FA5F|nr:voltage-dependent calcium channel beta subunit-associated regulatory protein-like isoform X3 [Halichoerus grypus]